ncbi:hypothetical protein PMI22_06085 [Pseudomonas sp. GM21]|jgi:hypothetical protein|uniref:hypothetical protein n=1 Tax=unclassified Pseudomonas TaxID=196821 RepID=UPI0002726002|nr:MULTISPECIES: hypothetical protein [unclassified Pseudomonas]EJM09483.1 hypothetical protein PMI22_06085 [Pseudomonas sp. GM21]MDR6926781.1 hypothetical protein [Pseudomonas sp. BE134]
MTAEQMGLAMNTRIIRITAAFAAILSLHGCASIVGETEYPVAVMSAPEGASFEIRNRSGQIVHTGNAPSTVTLKSGKGYFSGQTYTLLFKKEGYSDKTVTLDSDISGWYWGNFLIGGLIGLLIVDPVTGAMYKLPESISADMGKPVAKVSINTPAMVSIESLTEAQRAMLGLNK